MENLSGTAYISVVGQQVTFRNIRLEGSQSITYGIWYDYGGPFYEEGVHYTNPNIGTNRQIDVADVSVVRGNCSWSCICTELRGCQPKGRCTRTRQHRRGRYKHNPNLQYCSSLGHILLLVESSGLSEGTDDEEGKQKAMEKAL